MAAAQVTPVPPVLRGVIANGVKIHKSFKGPSGLTGWVLLRNDADPIVVYSTQDGKTLLTGTAIDEQGRDLNSGYVKAHAPKPDYSQFSSVLAQARAIPQGDPQGKNIVYVFFDPACPYCNRTYSAFKQATQNRSGTQIRWVPLAILSSKSAGQVAAMLGAASPTDLLDQHENRFASGGLTPVEVGEPVKKTLDDNLRLFRNLGFSGVPVVLYKGDSGELEATVGAPTPADIAKIVGTKG